MKKLERSLLANLQGGIFPAEDESDDATACRKKDQTCGSYEKCCKGLKCPSQEAATCEKA